MAAGWTRARRYLARAWSRVGAGYAAMELSDPAGEVLLAEGREDGRPGDLPVVTRTLVDPASGNSLGTLRLSPVAAALFPVDLLGAGFGERTFGMVVDRERGTLLYHPEPAARVRAVDEVLGPGFSTERLAGSTGVFRYGTADTTRVASYANLASAPWTVILSGAVDEFAAPFAALGRTTLGVSLALAALASILFGLLLGRTTRSLENLTEATAVVARGDFSPRLPEPGPDEIGRLSASFGTMVERVRTMMDEARTSRQMAVLGTFAAQLAHEIRSPTWPGNVRELRHAIQRAALLARGGVVGVEHLELGGLAAAERAAEPEDDTLDGAVKAQVERVLRKTGGHKSNACRRLGISRPTLDRLIERHGIEVASLTPKGERG